MVHQEVFDKIFAHESDRQTVDFFKDVAFEATITPENAIHKPVETGRFYSSCNEKVLVDIPIRFGRFYDKDSSFAPCALHAPAQSPVPGFNQLADLLPVLDRFNELRNHDGSVESFDELLALVRELLVVALVAGREAVVSLSPFSGSVSKISVFSAALSKAVTGRFIKETLSFITEEPVVSEDSDGSDLFRFMAFGVLPRTSMAALSIINDGSTRALAPATGIKFETLVKNYLLDAVLASRVISPYVGESRTQILLIPEREQKAVDKMGPLMSERVRARALRLTPVEFDLMRLLAKNHIEQHPPRPRKKNERDLDFDSEWVIPTLKSFEALKSS